MSFTGACRVEKAAIHKEDGEFGEEEAGTINHFGRVC